MGLDEDLRLDAAKNGYGGPLSFGDRFGKRRGIEPVPKPRRWMEIIIYLSGVNSLWRLIMEARYPWRSGVNQQRQKINQLGPLQCGAYFDMRIFHKVFHIPVRQYPADVKLRTGPWFEIANELKAVCPWWLDVLWCLVGSLELANSHLSPLARLRWQMFSALVLGCHSYGTTSIAKEC